MAGTNDQQRADVIPAEVPAGVEWFLARDGQQYGPLSESELADLAANQQLLPTDLLWNEGLPEWQPASTYLDARSPPPPVQQPPAAPVEPAFEHNPGPSALQYDRPPPFGAHRPDGAQPGAGYGNPQWHAPASLDQPPPSSRDWRTDQARPSHDAPRRPAHDRDQDAGDPGNGAKRARVRPSRRDTSDTRSRSGGRFTWLKRSAAILFFVLTLGAAGWALYPHRDQILRIAATVAPQRVDPSVRVPPMTGFSADGAETDQALQKALLWRTLKREFPEWYEEQIKSIAALAGRNESEAAIGQRMLRAIAELRRTNALNALSSTPTRIKAIASTFTDLLARLTEKGTDTCYAVISSGETGPTFLALLQTPELTPLLQSHLVAVFDAIGEGRRTPRVWPTPKDLDWGFLVTELEALGWSEADLRLFSDPARLASAPAAQVCRLVTQWYQGQLRLTDPDTQLRLLADALKPLLTG